MLSSAVALGASLLLGWAALAGPALAAGRGSGVVLDRLQLSAVRGGVATAAGDTVSGSVAVGQPGPVGISRDPVGGVRAEFGSLRLAAVPEPGPAAAALAALAALWLHARRRASSGTRC